MQRRILPVDSTSRLEVGRDDASIERLCAAMLFPDNPDDQREYFSDLENPIYKRPPQKNEIHQVSKTDLYSQAVEITNPVNTYFSRRIVKGIHDGVLSGIYLMCFRFLSTTEIKSKSENKLEPSLRAATFLCKEYDLGRGLNFSSDKDYEYPSISKKLAMEVWGKYKHVAHLWAAYIHLKGLPISVKTDPFEHAIQEIDLSTMLFLARQYERFVVEFFNGEKVGRVPRETIKPFRARFHDWNLDDVFQVEIPLPKDLIDSFKSNGSRYYPDA